MQGAFAICRFDLQFTGDEQAMNEGDEMSLIGGFAELDILFILALCALCIIR